MLPMTRARLQTYLGLHVLLMLYSLTDLFGKIAAGFDLTDWRFGALRARHRRAGCLCARMAAGHQALAPYHSVFVEGDHGFLGFGVGCFVLP